MSYWKWNQAIAEYFTGSLPPGSRVYLSLDSESLTLIGEQFFHDEPEQGWRNDFVSCLRNQLVRGTRVNTDRLELHHRSTGIPNCVALLGSYVLAAYDMADDEKNGVDARDFFSRLRVILGIDSDDRRPSGITSQLEEQLWTNWNRWLTRKNLIPTAVPGPKGPRKYINYPISQCLLRQADRDRLTRVFYEEQWNQPLEPESLFNRLQERYASFPRYLANLLMDSGERHDIIVEKIYEVYENHLECLELGIMNSASSRRKSSKNRIISGLYRDEDKFGDSEYFIYPRQSILQQNNEELSVVFRDSIIQLEIERAGKFYPLTDQPLTSRDLVRNLDLKVRGSNTIETLHLPQRDFWVLVPDPDDPNGGGYSSWHSPEVGTRFILLINETTINDLQALNQNGLINFGDQYRQFGDNQPWLEVIDVEILPREWPEDIILQNQELANAFKPRTRYSVSLSGGLLAPRQRAWLENYLPYLTVHAENSEIYLEDIIKLPSDSLINEPIALNSHQPYPLSEISDLTSGSYLLQVSQGSTIRRTFFSVISWNELEICKDTS